MESPDLELLRAGWERCGDPTSSCYGLYRRTDDPCWMQQKSARAIAFGESEELPAPADEDSIRVLLQRILEELQGVRAALGRGIAQ